MCNDAVEASPWQLKYVPDQYKTQKMCDEAVIDNSSSLQYIPDWFVRGDWVHMWYVDSEYHDYDNEVNFFKWYDSYKKEGSKSLNKRRALPHCLASVKILGLEYVRRRKKETEKLWK